MWTRKLLLVAFSGLFLAGIADIREVAGQDNVVVILAFDKTLINGTPAVSRAVTATGDPIYLQTDNIALRVEAMNILSDNVYVAYGANGFSGLPYHLLLSFTAPDGSTVTSSERPASLEPGPPTRAIVPDSGGVDRILVLDRIEILPRDWSIARPIPNARDYYSLTKAGRYSGKAVVPFREYTGFDYFDDAPPPPIRYYSEPGRAKPRDPYQLESNNINFSVVSDGDCDGYYYPDSCPTCPKPPHCPGTWVVHAGADCSDNDPTVNPGATEIPNGIDDDCNPATPDLLGIGNAGMGRVFVRADLHTVGGGSFPTVKKAPIYQLQVRIYDKSAGSCVAQLGLGWKNYKAIWDNCPVAGDTFTDQYGFGSFTMKPGDYAAFAWYPLDNLYVGGGVDPLLANQTVTRYLQIIQRADASKVPAKYTVKTGSELIVIEPEYIEWTDTQELYPFVFESVGDWGVKTAIYPPEGFVADKTSLATNVNSVLKAVQFTVTDVGSDWVDTIVEHLVTHKKKTERIKSRIGVIKKNRSLK